MIRHVLLLSAFIILSGIIGGTPRSAIGADPASIVSDLGSRALVAMRNGDTAAATQARLRQLFSEYFDVEACARSALGAHWQNATTQQRQEYVELYEDYVVIGYSVYLGVLGGQNLKVLESRPNEVGIIVTSWITGINAPIRVEWQLNLTNYGYKVTDVIVDGISMATTQHAELVSFIQRNSGRVPLLLVALRENNATSGFSR
jgi:phospholipid transport system substrate-binding protein